MSRFAHAVALAAAVGGAVLSGCSGESGPEPNGEDEPGEPVSAEIGAAGGTVAATLGSGSVVSLDVPAGALPSPVTFRITPIATPDGALGAFTLAPAGQPFRLPATLTVELPAQIPIRDVTTIAFKVGSGPRIPSGARADVTRRTLTLQLTTLYRASDTTAAGATRRGLRALRADEEVEGTIVEYDYAQILQEATTVMARFQANGSQSNAIDVERVMEGLSAFANRTATDPTVATLVTSWKSVTCAQYNFSVSSLNSFNFGSDYVGFAREVGQVLSWSQRVTLLGAYATAMGYSGCSGVPEDPDQPAIDRIDAFMEVVTQDLSNLTPSSPPDFEQLVGTRIPGLLDLIARLEFASSVGDRRDVIVNVVQAQVARVRDGAWDHCAGASPASPPNPQFLQQRLLALEFGDNAWAATTPYEVNALHEDIQYCAFRPFLRLLDADDNDLFQQRMGGSSDPTDTRKVLALQLSPEARYLEFGGTRQPTPLRALQCPSGALNDEWLVVLAGPTAGPLVEVGRATQGTARTYLIDEPFQVAVSVLRERAGATGNTGDGRLVIRRQPGTCNGEFPQIELLDLVTVNYTFSSTLRITTAPGALAPATEGEAYSVQLQASGGPSGNYGWSVTSGQLPTGVTLSTSGLISGTPSAAGTSSFMARVTDGPESAEASFSIEVRPGLCAEVRTGAVVISTNADLAAFANVRRIEGPLTLQFTTYPALVELGCLEEVLDGVTWSPAGTAAPTTQVDVRFPRLRSIASRSGRLTFSSFSAPSAADVNISFPVLTSIGSSTNEGDLIMDWSTTGGVSSIAKISAPALTTITGRLRLGGIHLREFEAPSLTSTGSGIDLWYMERLERLVLGPVRVGDGGFPVGLGAVQILDNGASFTSATLGGVSSGLTTQFLYIERNRGFSNTAAQEFANRISATDVTIRNNTGP